MNDRIKEYLEGLIPMIEADKQRQVDEGVMDSPPALYVTTIKKPTELIDMGLPEFIQAAQRAGHEADTDSMSWNIDMALINATLFPNLQPQPDDELAVIYLLVDGFVQAFDSEEEADIDRDRGDLEKDYASNPESEVSQTMILVMMTSVGDGILQTAYSLDDGGIVVWGKPNFVDAGDDHGAITTMLRKWMSGRTCGEIAVEAGASL